ncbi:uncharacterized protein [Watersipora subatra]|uniref:uncharacterized protein n=1 Tax=Watersipora subatra TaxID=2589382 RepID=UPI00355B79DB
MPPPPPTSIKARGWGVDDDLLFPELELHDGLFYNDLLTSDEKPPIIDGALHGTFADDLLDMENFQLADEQEHLNNIQEVDPVSCIPKQARKLSVSSTDDFLVTSNGSPADLVGQYGIDDAQLSDISLKKLRSLCKNDKDYDDLKAYRRTCQNRYYARLSRNKQQTKATGLARKLSESEQEIVRLQRENEMKDVTIKCLQLELQILRSGTPEGTISH